MDMIKIGILGIVSILLALFIKEWKPQFSVLISMTACILIFFTALTRMGNMAEMFAELTEQISIKESYMRILLKIIGISYVADFSSNLCKDAGYSAIAGQIEIFGKISVLTVSVPVMMALLSTISELLGG
ncbi:MAG: stage III sporulation protein AD [Marvinbryantia sp.]|jgi:stage III sporulation protein AD